MNVLKKKKKKEAEISCINSSSVQKMNGKNNFNNSLDKNSFFSEEKHKKMK
jgi:hypothetical protein